MYFYSFVLCIITVLHVTVQNYNKNYIIFFSYI